MGVIIGIVTLIVSLFSYTKSKKRDEKKKKKMAKEFLAEIEIIEIEIKFILEKCKGDGFRRPRFMHDIMSQKYGNPKIVKLYDENGLFIRFSKEIYDYDENICLDMSKFYNNVIKADEHYQKYIQLYESYSDLSEGYNKSIRTKLYPAIRDCQKQFIHHLNEANSVVSDLKILLDNVSKN
ncbi:hypothetical protein ACSAZK_02365 [Methanosarcina sp. Mfa9]|uniref:hypothetical protein n=1 Tax=Methanosarcina sp. Mfa9 TaxID=3439063 RepID=UPI003F8304B7